MMSGDDVQASLQQHENRTNDEKELLLTKILNHNNNGTNYSSYQSHEPADEEGERAGFETNNPNYFDSSWANNILMDPNNEMLYNLTFGNNSAHPSVVPPEQGSNNDISANSSVSSDIHLLQENSKSKALMQSSKCIKPRRPCDHCRRRKTKCVIAPSSNKCVQCEAKSLKCTFIEQAVKRKPVGEPESEKKRIKDMPYGSTGGFSANVSIVPPNVRIREAQPVHDYSVIHNSLLKKTLSLQFPRSSFYVGPTSYLYDVNLFNYIINTRALRDSKSQGSSKIEQINLDSTTSLRKVTGQTQFLLRDDQSPMSYQSMSNDVDAIEKYIAPHGQILIDLYFRIIHPSYPILHKKVFLEKYSRTHREFSAPLLAAVYVLAVQWWEYDPQLNKFPKPDINSILKIGLNNFLTEISKRPKLSAVQAGLLLLQCKSIVHNREDKSSLNEPQLSSIQDIKYSEWVLYAQVIALAEELGLGLDCNKWKLPKWERGLRKRLAWAVYIEDKWLSLKKSRPSHINQINWVVKSLVDDDFPEKHGDGDLKEGSSDIDNGKQIFKNLISLSIILSDILDQLYSMKAMSEVKNIHQVLQMAKPLQLTLRNWYHSLPVELQMSSSQPRKLCSNGYLQLAYFATEITLHRKIVTMIYEQTLNGVKPSDELVEICRSAAKTRLLAAIDFVRELKPEHIHSFWHSSASPNFTLIGTFAAILYISSNSKKESEFYKDQIYNYRWILKISSKGFDQAKEALEKLELVLNQIEGLLSDSANLPAISATATPPQFLQNNPQELNQHAPIMNENDSNINPGNPDIYKAFDAGNQGSDNYNNNGTSHRPSSYYYDEQALAQNYNTIGLWKHDVEEHETKSNLSYVMQPQGDTQTKDHDNVSVGGQAPDSRHGAHSVDSDSNHK